MTLVASTAGASVPNAPGTPTVSAFPAGSGPYAVGIVAGVTITGYTVTSSPGSLTCTSVTLSCNIPGLSASTAYTFTVVASSSGGSGPASASSTPYSTSGLSTSTISLSAFPQSAENVNAAVTFTALVTSGATGTVAFYDGGAVIPGCQYRVIDSGYATCTTSTLTAGSPSITAIYSGDSNFSSSTSAALSYTISGSTLTAASSPLVVTSTGAAINTTISVVVSGGNGGPITFTWANGTATGCSISGTTLSVPSNVSGTCLVTATQANYGTYLADVSNVATENFFWNYATYPYSYYYCTSGDTLSGSTCTHETPEGTEYYASEYYCPSGWTGGPSESPVTCYRDASISQAACTADVGTWEGSYCILYTGNTYGTDGGAFGYTCGSLWVMIGTNCYLQSTYSAYTGVAYSCPYGGTESGLICTISGGSGPNLRQPRRSLTAVRLPRKTNSPMQMFAFNVPTRSSQEVAS